MIGPVTPRRARVRMLAVAGVLGGLVATACSSTFTPPAAIVGGRAISQEALARAVDLNLRLQPPTGQSLDRARKDATRQTLSVLIEQDVILSYARDRGIETIPSEVSRALAQTVQQVGGQSAFDRILKERRLGLAEVRQSIATNVLIGKVEAAVLTALRGPAASSLDAQTQDQLFFGWIKRRIASEGVQVNPRFGRFDAARVQIVPITSTAG